ncbi:hypothetical protein [Candidatus Marithrix sp. Canyon 246]|uniref:hypothetical protein n=1 Tax=Candidatus Marithrix sp. Canyon 246 TaxID=1827136 RepID=UPI00084A196C|nr:hypothetical protein [Candidatus Marithrix sp. Canyon 246]
MKTLIIFSLLLTIYSTAYSYGYYGGGMNSMPKPYQYRNYDQYQQALQIWQDVAVKRQNQVFVEPMPMPDQYRNYDQYQQALRLWQQVYGR